ncbi:MAG: AAA family ATPase, partial [Thermoleophilaceae bacterium]
MPGDGPRDGFPFEHGLHATQIATRLGDRLGIDPGTASETYYDRPEMVPGGRDGSPPADTRVVGRERELAAVDALLAEPAPAGVVLEGPAGIGKTTVWQLGLDIARERGHRVLVTRPLESDAGLALAGVADLVGDLIEEHGRGLPEPQERALRIALRREEDPEASADPLGLNAGTRGLLRLAAAERPLLVAIDDLQWLDRSSGDVLRHALRRLDGEEVRLLGAGRTGGAAPLDLGIPTERVQRLELAPLELKELRDLVARDLGRHLPLPHLRRIHDLSGGNPFYALELCRSIGADVVERGEPNVRGAALERLVGNRLAALPPATVEALGTVAAAGQPDLATISAVLADEEALDAAFRSGVLGEDAGMLRFSHPLLAAAAYESLPPRRRRETHERLADIAVDPEPRARHLAAAATGPDAAAARAAEDGAAAA